MNKINRETICVLILVSILAGVHSVVIYRVISSGPNGTRATINIKERSLFWSLVLRFNNTIKLKVISGGTVTSSSPERRIFVIAGPPIEAGRSQLVTFESKYDKKRPGKLISATYNGKPVKVN